MDHVCEFPTELGRVLDDAVCLECGRSVMEGYELPIDIEPASSAGEEGTP